MANKGSGSILAKALAKRLLFGLLSLLFLSLVTFLIDEVAPGDAAMVVAGEKATVAQVQDLRHKMGLDRPWPIRYGEYLWGVSHGDFGRSYYGTRDPVSNIVVKALPMTLMVAIPAILLASILGLVLGTLAAINENKWLDQVILGFSTLGVTIPNFVLAPVLVIIFALQLQQLPTTWEVNLRAPVFYYLLLPTIILAARPAASLTRLTRASMIETLQQEFIKLARAKGVPAWRLYIFHALRNAFLPVFTAIGTNFGYLLTGSFIVETVFIMPGMGLNTIDAIQKGDTPVIMAMVMVTGGLFITVNLLVDILMPFLDPRIREAQV